MDEHATTTLARLAGLNVGDCMTSDVVTVTATDSCRWALRVMDAAGVNHLPVLDGARVVGILTERDVHRRAPHLFVLLPEGGDVLEHVKVGGVMTYGPVTTDPTARLADAIATMQDREVGGLPVLDAGSLVGIVTTQDVLRILREAIERAPGGGAEQASAGDRPRTHHPGRHA